MKRKPVSRKELLFSCEHVGPEDGLDPKIFFRSGSFKKTNRKALQLCGEVEKTLSYSLAWELGDELLGQLIITRVVPAPDSTRLLVTVSPGATLEDSSRAEILERLHRATGWQRSLIAAAIHRRRVPDLTFEVEWTKEVNS